MRPVSIRAEAWQMPAILAVGPLDRLLGRRRVRSGRAVVVRTRSVHTFFESEPIRVAVVGRSMQVSRLEEMPPRRVIFSPGARYIIELTGDSSLPPLGAVVEIDGG